MITRKFLQLPTIDGIKAGSAATDVGSLSVKPNFLGGTGVRISKIALMFQDGTNTAGNEKDILAMIGDITAFKNSSEFRLHSAAELDYLNSQNGTAYAYQKLGTGVNMRQYLTIFFFEPWRKDTGDGESQCLIVDPTQGWNKDGLQIQIKLLQAMPASASLSATIYCDAFVPNTKVQQVVKSVKRLQITASGSEIDYLALPSVGKIQGINLKNPTTGYVSSVIIKSGSEVYIDDVKREDMIAHLTSMGINPPLYASTGAGAFGYSIVFDDTDPINSGLDVDTRAPWMKLKFSQAAAGNVVALVESVSAI